MRKVLFVLILLGGGIDLATPVLHAQGTDSTTVVAVLLVQFANQDTCREIPCSSSRVSGAGAQRWAGPTRRHRSS